MRRFAFALAVVSLVTAANRCLAESTAADQQIAQAIVETLREHQQAGRLKGFDIDLNVENGRVVLTGNVTSEEQHDLAIDAARYAPGVKMVVNDLKIKGESRQHPEQQKPATAGLLNGLRKAWAQPSSQQATAEPIEDAVPPAGTAQATPNQAVASAQTTGKQIDRMANPDPLKEDKHIAGGYSAFTANAARKPVATVDEVSGAPAFSQVEQQQEPAEQIIAASNVRPQQELSQWAPREITPVAAEPQQQMVAPAVASNASPQAQQASANAAATQTQAAPIPTAQPQAQPQYQAVQVIPVPVPMYPQAAGRPQMPVAYAASRLPGGMPQGQVRMAQAVSPQQVAPAPQFIQSTSSGMAPARYDHPRMPGYAWPSYASYPNYAALQYPKQYSAHAWPYIGPFYPYPQVPLGWRKVTLSWDDGWWHLDFKDRGYGPYVTR